MLPTCQTISSEAIMDWGARPRGIGVGGKRAGYRGERPGLRQEERGFLRGVAPGANGRVRNGLVVYLRECGETGCWSETSSTKSVSSVP